MHLLRGAELRSSLERQVESVVCLRFSQTHLDNDAISGRVDSAHELQLTYLST